MYQTDGRVMFWFKCIIFVSSSGNRLTGFHPHRSSEVYHRVCSYWVDFLEVARGEPQRLIGWHASLIAWNSIAKLLNVSWFRQLWLLRAFVLFNLPLNAWPAILKEVSSLEWIGQRDVSCVGNRNWVGISDGNWKRNMGIGTESWEFESQSESRWELKVELSQRQYLYQFSPHWARV